MKYNIGDTAIVKARHNGHNFNIGEQITIVQKCERDGDYNCQNENGKMWWLTDTELKKPLTRTL